MYIVALWGTQLAKVKCKVSEKRFIHSISEKTKHHTPTTSEKAEHQSRLPT